MQEPPPPSDTVYVSGIPPHAGEQDLAELFATIGMLKMDRRTNLPKIWLYRDKATGALKGDGTDPYAAGAAVEWFNNKEFLGSVLQVSLAQRKGEAPAPVAPIIQQPQQPEYSEQPGMGADGAKPEWQKDGDWQCPNPR
eukprot:jgi/Chlat1/5806/Chrsp4S06280